MKRLLVEYASSEEENEHPKQRKRKLPALSASLTVPTPVDDPALHQGRVRTVPHVEGQYATHVYVPVVLHHEDALYTLLEDALDLAKTRVPSLHPIGRQERSPITTARWELHVSLSRPLFLRAHQRDEFKRAVRQVTSLIAPCVHFPLLSVRRTTTSAANSFDASFTTFSELTNDERTRTFLALEVGAGHGELRRCLNILEPTLRLLRQREFYVDPKLHTSIAWALMEKTPSSSKIAPFSVTGELEEIASPKCAAPEEQQARSASQSVIERPSDEFCCIPHFPHTLVPSLNEAYSTKLSQARTGGFVVDKISAKIGKDIFTWPLNGIK